MKTKTIAIKDLRNSVSAVADEMESGKGVSFTVFRRSRPSFKIVPIDANIEEKWETVVDFTTQNDEGIDIDTALNELQ